MTRPEGAPTSPSTSPVPAEPGSDAAVLVIEDDPALAWSIERAMRARGLQVHVASTGRDALRTASAVEPDVVVLDLGLPDMQGADVCRQLRRWMGNPIIVLTVDDGENRKVDLLDAGADDYITKPFSMPELLARVRVALRHRAVLARLVDPTQIVIGDVAIDEAGHLVHVRGATVSMTPKEFALLVALAKNAGRVLAHATLLEQVWGPDAVDKVEYLRTHVNQLRRKLGSGPDRPTIVTEPGVGYRLVLP